MLQQIKISGLSLVGCFGGVIRLSAARASELDLDISKNLLDGASEVQTVKQTKPLPTMPLK